MARVESQWWFNERMSGSVHDVPCQRSLLPICIIMQSNRISLQRCSSQTGITNSIQVARSYLSRSLSLASFCYSVRICWDLVCHNLCQVSYDRESYRLLENHRSWIEEENHVPGHTKSVRSSSQSILSRKSAGACRRCHASQWIIAAWLGRGQSI